jgi:hypothetical protein
MIGAMSTPDTAADDRRRARAQDLLDVEILEQQENRQGLERFCRQPARLAINELKLSLTLPSLAEEAS